MITRIKLTLEQAEYSALLRMAENDLRDPQAQARYIIRRALLRRGLMARERIHVAPKPNVEGTRT